jgi:hypothetical protein
MRGSTIGKEDLINKKIELQNLRLWACNMTSMSSLHLYGYSKTAWLFCWIKDFQSVVMQDEIHVVPAFTWILMKDGYRVVAAVGMGGVGKNLLVETVNKCFDHQVWLTVSQKVEMAK